MIVCVVCREISVSERQQTLVISYILVVSIA